MSGTSIWDYAIQRTIWDPVRRKYFGARVLDGKTYCELTWDGLNDYNPFIEEIEHRRIEVLKRRFSD